MKIIRDLKRAEREREAVVTIGAFDGLHRGHQQLLRLMMGQARESGRISTVVTFDPLPRVVLQPDPNTVCLTTAEDKIELLAEWGLDRLVIVPFTPELAQTPAETFVQMLFQQLCMAELWIGWDFGLGRGRGGDVRTLEQLGETMGFGVHVVEPVDDGSTVISSTAIRKSVLAGRVRKAARMLGRPYQVRATVVAGLGRGKQLGYPTANLLVSERCALPGGGVFAAYVIRGDRRHCSVLNIGCRPTFDEGEQAIEAHLLDFHGSLFGEQLRVQFVERLRSERRFSSPDALVAQIGCDVIKARALLGCSGTSN